MKYNFRIKLQGDKRAVSYRNIEAVYMVNESKFIVDVKGTKTMIRQYIKSMFKEVYKLPITFNFRKATNLLQIFIDIDKNTYNDYVKLTKILKQFTAGYSPLDDIKTGREIFFSIDDLSVYMGNTNTKSSGYKSNTPTPTTTQVSAPTPTPTPMPTPTQQSNSKNYILSEQQLENIYGSDWKIRVDWIDEFDYLFLKTLTDQEEATYKSGTNVTFEFEGVDCELKVEATSLACYQDYNGYSAEEIEEIIDALNLFVSIVGIDDQEKQSATELLLQLKIFKLTNK